MSKESGETPKVYSVICEVMADIAEVGIAKNHRADMGRGGQYNFRGIDDVYQTLSAILSKRRLVIAPRIKTITREERTNKYGNALIYTVAEVEYHIVAAEDGSVHVTSTIGEAMDSSDKASNKAMSAAYKYLCFQLFCIPVDGIDSEADNQPAMGSEPASNPPSDMNDDSPIGGGGGGVPPSKVTDEEFNASKDLIDTAKNWADVAAETKKRMIDCQKGKLGKPQARILAVTALTVGASVVKAGEIDKFMNMARWLADQKILQKKEVQPLVDSARASANVAPEKL